MLIGFFAKLRYKKGLLFFDYIIHRKTYKRVTLFLISIKINLTCCARKCNFHACRYVGLRKKATRGTHQKILSHDLFYFARKCFLNGCSILTISKTLFATVYFDMVVQFENKRG